MNDLSRRHFLAKSAVVATGASLAANLPNEKLLGDQPTAQSAATTTDFASDWNDSPNRVWAGAEFWANPLQDWRVAGGRLECVHAAPDRNVHLLTREVAESAGTLALRVRAGRVDGSPLGGGKGSFGFRIGIRGPLPDFRNALIFGKGLDCGLTCAGGLFIGNPASAKPLQGDAAAVELRLSAEPQGDGKTKLTLSAQDAKSGQALGSITRENVPSASLAGGLALVANFGKAGGRGRGATAKATNQASTGTGEFWFNDWQVSGSRLVAHDERTFGPILFTQYTLSDGTLKLSAQMPPLGEQDNWSARLEVERDGKWQTVDEQTIDRAARTVAFRVEKWDAAQSAPYRVAYALKNASGQEQPHFWAGTIRREPLDEQRLRVADISCNGHMTFPNTACVDGVAKLNPDLIAFTGDQYYEGSGGYGIQRGPLEVALLDVLRKWYLHGWTWRELMRDRPSISIPDDHDVYHGNLWGEGGAAVAEGKFIDHGGYQMAAEFVNVVHRTQTSHHPDPYDGIPGKRGVTAYFGPLNYGRVSFAILADRQFKSGPDEKVPPTSGRPDHVTDPNFDPQSANLPGLELLGERQIQFLREWAADWRGADMKAVISQTIFTAMATTHGKDRQVLVADYDANGWPQAGRDAALREMRRAFAFHLAGDQHLPAVVHYGIDAHRDAGVAFASPTVNNVYPRWFEPKQPGANRAAGAPENTGDFRDGFGNCMTVLAVANARPEFAQEVLQAEVDKASGIGLVTFDKKNRTITIDCWPLLADTLKPGTQFPGWPVTVGQMANYERAAPAQLPKLLIRGSERPVVQIVDEKSGDVVYTLRTPAVEWQPAVFAEGKYTIHLSDPEAGKSKTLEHIEAKAGNQLVMDVTI